MAVPTHSTSTPTTAVATAEAAIGSAEGVGLPALVLPLMYSFEWKCASDPKIELKPGMELSVFFETNKQSFRGTVLSTSADGLDFEVGADDGYVEIEYSDGETFNKCLYRDEWPFKVFATNEEVKAAADAAAAANAADVTAKPVVAAATAASKVKTKRKKTTTTTAPSSTALVNAKTYSKSTGKLELLPPLITEKVVCEPCLGAKRGLTYKFIAKPRSVNPIPHRYL